MKHTEYGASIAVKDHKVFLPKDKRRREWNFIKKLRILSKVKFEKARAYYMWSDMIKATFKNAYRNKIKLATRVFRKVLP